MRRGGREGAYVPAAAAPASAPLDGLSAPDRAKIVEAFWIGGQLFTDTAVPWCVAKRASDGYVATQTISSLAELATFGAGTTVKLYEIRDQSGNNRHLLPVDAAYMGILYEGGSPILAPNGRTLAAELPEYIADFSYARGDILGLPADSSAMQVMWDVGQATAEELAYFIPWCFGPGVGPTDSWHYLGQQLLDVGAEYLQVQGYAPDYNVFWDNNGAGGASPAPGYGDISHAAGAPTSAVVARWNGVALSPATVQVAGTPSLADSTAFGIWGWNGPEEIVSAMIVLNAPLSAPGQAICDAFFASLVTPSVEPESILAVGGETITTVGGEQITEIEE